MKSYLAIKTVSGREIQELLEEFTPISVADQLRAEHPQYFKY